MANSRPVVESPGAAAPTTLRGVLEAAARELHAEWLGVAELALDEVPFSPRWLVTTDEQRAGAPPPRECFEALRRGESASPSVLKQAPWPGSALAAAVSVVALDLEPGLSGYADACLILYPEARADSQQLRALHDSLRELMAPLRRARLAEVLLAAIEQAADPVELSDREGRLFYVNRAWESFTGYARVEALGATAAQLFRDPEGSNHDPQFYRFAMSELHAGRPWLGAMTGKVKEGRRVFSEAHVAPFAAAGALRGHVAIRRDLTERSSRDLALLAAHREFREVLVAISDGVCVLRGDLIYFTNAAFDRILGRAESSLGGLRFADALHADDRAHFELANLSEVSRVRAVRPDGSHRFVEISRAGDVSFDGHPATILLVRDTTDYQMAQEELSRAEKLSALGSLAAGVAHEINNPLAYVALNLDLLRERCSTRLAADELEALEEAIGGVSRMREIAGELHTFSGRDLPGPPGPVDVARAVSSALNLVNNEIRQRAVLQRDLEPNVFALAREGQLVQVCVNLLVNAVQAIPSPSDREHTIAVTTRAVEDGVEITITDTGVGIPESALPQLFEPFATSKRRGEGSGLGLAICKRIINDLNGDIRIVSSRGEGTRVVISLPLAQVPTPSEAPVVSTRLRPEPARVRILVVEDELPIARALQKLLAAHEVVWAADGNAALSLLQGGDTFDCILCDLMMPSLSGATFFGLLSERWPALARRTVIMTGGAVTPDCKEFLDGFRGEVLRKPFSLEAAQQCISRVVTGKGSEPERRAR